MAINNPVADKYLVIKLNERLEEFRKFRYKNTGALKSKKKKESFFKRIFS